MAADLKIDITDSEWEIMRVLWTQKECTSNDVIRILKEKMTWQPTTIKTLLARLVKKDLVGTEKEGNRYRYRPLVSESESWEAATDSLFEHICAQKMGRKIASMIRDSKLSFADIEMLEETLKKKRQSAVAAIDCDCTPGQCGCEPGTCSATQITETPESLN
ncbi:MAG: CopY/TcrY family copper transport repressor [Xanthomonadaceae bacterium]|nr:CopY/TcrY family copper transport repressor [Xanthomonadaceae bacterium]